MRAVLISIKSKWCAMIADGRKTVEIRKSVPKILTPFKVYIYCSRGKDRLLDIIREGDNVWGETYHGPKVFVKTPESSFAVMNSGKVIGEFVCDCYAPITVDKDGVPTLYYQGDAKDWRACVTVKEFIKYIGDTSRRGAWAWHISNLKIYDRPMNLEDFGVKRPPMSWQYVEELSD